MGARQLHKPWTPYILPFTNTLVREDLDIGRHVFDVKLSLLLACVLAGCYRMIAC